MNSKYTNELINESSPYLLQHAHNPVNWLPWGEKALKKAKEENKLLIISIGYAACHWCHVMEHESFEDTEVADLMNAHFVCVKVDREERPDVDQVYMNAAHLITGRGGWPLNALALPDGRPFYAGTYFPKTEWLRMLNHFVEMKQQDFGNMLSWADKITQGIKSLDDIPKFDTVPNWKMQDINMLFTHLLADLDMQKGGQKSAPKFPMPCNWDFVLQYHALSDNPKALKAVTLTLDNMALGGIYDQLGGGFARYSTDEDWRVPHFEKMLYDNAQLVSLYSHAYQLTKKPLYKNVIQETLAFVEAELTSPEGMFYSSLDADSEGVEGRYYVWTAAEIKSVLGAEADLFMQYYNVSEDGNWEHGVNVLYRNPSEANFVVDASTLDKIQNAKEKLLAVRNEREKPRLDDKVLTSWNALMLSAYVHAYRALGDEQYLITAIKTATYLLTKVISSQYFISRNCKNGKSEIAGLLDDYAFVIAALIDLYQVSFIEKYLDVAHRLTEYVIAHFQDEENGLFFYTHKSYSDLIARQKELSDNVIPASNSEMAKNLFILGHYYSRQEWIDLSTQMLATVSDQLSKNINFYANWAQLALLIASSPQELALVGTDYSRLRKELDQYYLPQIILMGANKPSNLSLLRGKWKANKTQIYLCKDKVCGLPYTKIEDVLLDI